MQRLALCRALVYEPDLLLLDEPFSNLDAKLREQMRVEVKLLQRRLGITVLFVTHDQIEALSLSDRIAVMQRGRVEQVGPPRSLYERPASAFVRDFLGPDRDPARPRRPGAAPAASRAVTVAMNGAARRACARRAAGAGRDASRPARRRTSPSGRRTSRCSDGRACPDGTRAARRDRHAPVRGRPLRGARDAWAASSASCSSCPAPREWREGQALPLGLPAGDGERVAGLTRTRRRRCRARRAPRGAGGALHASSSRVVAFCVVFPVLLVVLQSFQVAAPGEPARYGLDGWRAALGEPGLRERALEHAHGDVRPPAPLAAARRAHRLAARAHGPARPELDRVRLLGGLLPAAASP